MTCEISVIFQYFIILFPTFERHLKTDNYMSKIEYLIWQCDTSLHLATCLLVRNGSYVLTLTSFTTLLAIMKYMSRPKSTAAKDIDIVSIYQQRRYGLTSSSYTSWCSRYNLGRVIYADLTDDADEMKQMR